MPDLKQPIRLAYVGMLRSVQASVIRYGRCLRHCIASHDTYISDGGSSVWVCDVDPRPGALRLCLRTVHHNLLLRIVGFQRRRRTEQLIAYANALKKASCKRVETTILKRRHLFAEAVQWATNERLARLVPFELIADGDSLLSCCSETNRPQCVEGDLRVFRATNGSTRISYSLLEVDTALLLLWPTATKKSG